MNALTKRSFLCLVSFVMILPVLACSGLTETIEDEITQQAKEVMQELLDSVGILIKEEIEVQKENLKELTQEAIQNGKEWLGLEVPDTVGELEEGLGQSTASFIIPSIFQEVYKNHGGGRVLGKPTGKVSLQDGALVQYFEGGRNERSVIIMEDGTGDAFVIFGKWLEIYEYIGGPKEAGFPTTDAKTRGSIRLNQLKMYGTGKTQLFKAGVDEYALMMPSRQNSVFIMPPIIWESYIRENFEKTIGYPISSLPFDMNGNYAPELAGYQEFKHIFDNQPAYIQVFENGSLWLDKNNNTVKIIEEEGALKIDILTGIGKGIKNTYEYGLDQQLYEDCVNKTFSTTYKLALAEGVRELLNEVAKIPLKATVTAISAGTNSVTAKLILSVGGHMLDLAGSDQIGIDIITKVGVIGVDALFAKLVGDYLALPATQVTEEIIKVQVEKFFNNRHIWSISTANAPDKSNFSEDVKLIFMYDPKTHYTSGIFISGCADMGYFFMYETNPTSGNPIGEVATYDLKTGEWIKPK